MARVLSRPFPVWNAIINVQIRNYAVRHGTAGSITYLARRKGFQMFHYHHGDTNIPCRYTNHPGKTSRQRKASVAIKITGTYLEPHELEVLSREQVNADFDASINPYSAEPSSVFGLLSRAGLVEPQITNLLAARPQLFKLSSEYQLKPIMEFLQNVGVEDEALPTILRRMTTENLTLPIEATLEPKRKLLLNLGVTTGGMGKLFQHSRSIASKNGTPHMINTLKGLEEHFYISKNKVGMFLSECPRAFDLSPSLLQHRKELFQQLGVPANWLESFVLNDPNILVFASKSQFRDCLQYFESQGVSQPECALLVAALTKIVDLTSATSLHIQDAIDRLEGVVYDTAKRYESLLLKLYNDRISPRAELLCFVGVEQPKLSLNLHGLAFTSNSEFVSEYLPNMSLDAFHAFMKDVKKVLPETSVS
eukprot:CAMPEP_0184692222 /NCGR_PEP_ID=MMETSP0313-20130426/790_1 /TAXON_ID=2792 /ORGANISM="Porphyridium aerugineum, Strain SAG 1380-2" /LENGTH=421 /DNA_ID=CAMNT_0027150037 /DNA_START=81 /DNA_END=1346 /DNA_ORIENTATION=+